MRKEQAYLLRLWTDSKQDAWRVRLENVRSREVKTFANLTELTAFLTQESQEKPSQTTF
jgi:hypothetical protein